MSRCLLCAVLTLLFGLLFPARAEEPEPKASVKSPLKLIFEEDFKTFAVGRFRHLRSGESNSDLLAGTVTLHEGTGWERAVATSDPVGARAEFALKLTFGALKPGESTETEFAFVLANGQIVGAVFRREMRDDKSAGEIQITVQNITAQGISALKVLRRFPVTEDLSSGEWSLTLRHGLIVVRQGEKEFARGYVDAVGMPVRGIIWDQLKGRLTCGGMRVSGEVPDKRSVEDENRLREAARLNQQGMKLYSQDALEALTPTKQASDLYLQVLGEMHYDTANSFYNVAKVLEKGGATGEAVTFFERSLKVRRKVLGDDHPQLGQTLLELGLLQVKREQAAEARAAFAAALPIFESAYGNEHDLCLKLKLLIDQR